MRPAAADRPDFRTDIQGLRAVAVLVVVAYHAGLPGISGGYVGVDVFFVISGFLITGLLWRELAAIGALSLAAFYARRIRRLLPAAVLVLVATLGASWLWLAPLQVPSVARDAAAAALYAANYRFALQGTDYLSAQAPPSPVQHFWSLGVEEQFYLLWPVLLVLAAAVLRPARLTRAGAAWGLGVLGAGSFVLSLVLTDRAQPWAFYSRPSRVWELAGGAVLALAAPGYVASPTRWQRGWVGSAWPALGGRPSARAGRARSTRGRPRCCRSPERWRSSPPAAPTRARVPTCCWHGGRCRKSAGCRTPCTCGTGRC